MPSPIKETGDVQKRCFTHEEIWALHALSSTDDPKPLIEAQAAIELPANTFVLIAAEASVANTLRATIVGERGIKPGCFKASNYWQKAEIGTHISIE